MNHELASKSSFVVLFASKLDPRSLVSISTGGHSHDQAPAGLQSDSILLTRPEEPDMDLLGISKGIDQHLPSQPTVSIERCLIPERRISSLLGDMVLMVG